MLRKYTRTTPTATKQFPLGITRPRCEVTADQVAHKLPVHSRWNPGHRPSRASLPRPAEDDQEDCNFTRPFTTSELLLGIKVMKQNKATGKKSHQLKEVPAHRSALPHIHKLFEKLILNHLPPLPLWVSNSFPSKHVSDLESHTQASSWISLNSSRISI